MQNLKIFFSVMFLLIFSICTGYSADSETLWRALTFSDTPDSAQEAQQLAYANPNILEEVLFISDSNRDNSVARESSLILLEKCSLKGIITKERYFNNAFRLLAQIDNYVNPQRISSEKKLITTLLANYGFNQFKQIFEINLFDNFSSLLSFLNTMFSNGLIKNNGILNSLKSKISNAKDLLEKKTENVKIPAINKIEAAISEAEAQKGNHLTAEATTMFVTYCQNLITQIKNTSF